MSNLLTDFISYFKSKGLVTNDGTDAFRDVAPDMPNSAVVLYEYAGGPLDNEITSVLRSVQVVARDVSATTAREKALSLFSSLVVESGIIKLTTERWGVVHMRNVPIKIKVDEAQRVYYGFNVGIDTYID